MKPVFFVNGNPGECRVWFDKGVWYAYLAEFYPQGGRGVETEAFQTRAEAWEFIAGGLER